ncbi:hypothetical protein GHT07_21155 [Caenimonas koreensis DSM 17982]|uniref:Uncharacterized protein n=1 Tax=Caenimonas koreensis DSM 17982 TaxID=1121255 RepID=A0A844AZL9_9BURK|nr:hypothetical protein [Caenimonas koreensis]MRD49785.1 hypothetical protein [Caenimonas koreensis DSM 17982]
MKQRSNHIEVFVDGIEGILVGRQNSKIPFTSFGPDWDGDEENSERVLTVVVATDTLVGICLELLTRIAEEKDGLLTGLQQDATAFSEAVSHPLIQQLADQSKPKKSAKASEKVSSVVKAKRK